MQIKIEIDVQPEELRRFLGLPDVSGLQEEVVSFLRDKVADANETFDPTSFVKANIETFRNNKTLQRILYGSEPGEAEPPKRKPRKRSSSRRSRPAKD